MNAIAARITGMQHIGLPTNDMEKTIAFLNALEPKEGMSGVHAPGQNLEKTRQRNRERGIPVTEETWQKILDAAK